MTQEELDYFVKATKDSLAGMSASEALRLNALAEWYNMKLNRAVAEEREACAEIAGSCYGEGYAQQAGYTIASRIRARSSQ